jgi:hypothetical protein
MYIYLRAVDEIKKKKKKSERWTQRERGIYLRRKYRRLRKSVCQSEGEEM